MARKTEQDTTEVDATDAAEDAKAALEVDAQGRPYLPTSEAHQRAMEQGYYGYDGKDLGAAVSPEDVRSFEEHSDAGVDNAAHSEAPVIEVPGGSVAGFSAMSSGSVTGTPAPVEGGDATKADAPASPPA